MHTIRLASWHDKIIFYHWRESTWDQPTVNVWGGLQSRDGERWVFSNHPWWLPFQQGVNILKAESQFPWTNGFLNMFRIRFQDGESIKQKKAIKLREMVSWTTAIVWMEKSLADAIKMLEQCRSLWPAVWSNVFGRSCQRNCRYFAAIIHSSN